MQGMASRKTQLQRTIHETVVLPTETKQQGGRVSDDKPAEGESVYTPLKTIRYTSGKYESVQQQIHSKLKLSRRNLPTAVSNNYITEQVRHPQTIMKKDLQNEQPLKVRADDYKHVEAGDEAEDYYEIFDPEGYDSEDNYEEVDYEDDYEPVNVITEQMNKPSLPGAAGTCEPLAVYENVCSVGERGRKVRESAMSQPTGVSGGKTKEKKTQTGKRSKATTHEMVVLPSSPTVHSSMPLTTVRSTPQPQVATPPPNKCSTSQGVKYENIQVRRKKF